LPFAFFFLAFFVAAFGSSRSPTHTELLALPP
jgi:hypothetical protein